MKIATCKLFWKKSPSADIQKVLLKLSVSGTETEVTLGPDTQEFIVDVNADSDIRFSIDSVDSDGLVASSTTFLFHVGDLEAPLPATDLGVSILSVRDSETPPS